MTSALCYRNARHIIPNSNLAFIRLYTDDKNQKNNPKAVATKILQNEESQPDIGTEEKVPEGTSAGAEEIVAEYPEEPTTCCMSGCANCVWLEYAEKLSAYYKDGGEKAVKEIDERITDPSLKAFLMHELRMRQKAS